MAIRITNNIAPMSTSLLPIAASEFTLKNLGGGVVHLISIMEEGLGITCLTRNESYTNYQMNLPLKLGLRRGIIDFNFSLGKIIKQFFFRKNDKMK